MTKKRHNIKYSIQRANGSTLPSGRVVREDGALWVVQVADTGCERVNVTEGDSQFLLLGQDDGSVVCWQGRHSETAKWLLMCGDSRDALRRIPANSVNCVVTSPPYFWLRDYGCHGQIGLETSVAEYTAAITSTMQEVYRVLRDDGLLFLNLGDTYYSGKGESQGKDKKSTKRRFGLRAVDRSGGLGIGLQRKSAIGIPWRVALQMCQDRWILRSPIIWHKDKGLPEAVTDRPRRSYEYVFMFAKSRKYFFNRGPILGKDFDEDVWTIAPRIKELGALDTAPYPDDLVQRCLEIGCPSGGIVLDPFCGSGTTLRVALQSNRSAIGIELNPDFCRHVVLRLQNSGGGQL